MVALEVLKPEQFYINSVFKRTADIGSDAVRAKKEPMQVHVPVKMDAKYIISTLIESIDISLKKNILAALSVITVSLYGFLPLALPK